MIREVELKYRLPNKTSYEHFLSNFKGKHNVEEQTNYIFDTSDWKLRKELIFVRLRKVGNIHIVTCKGKPLDNNHHIDLLSIHDEWETYVDNEIAESLLNSNVDATYFLRDWFQNGSKEQEATRIALLKRIQAITAEPLGLVGSFTNTRTRIPYKIGKHNLDFEVDATNFGKERIDYEIELELPESLDPKLAQAELEQLFQNLNIEAGRSSSKSERFFSLQGC